MQVAHVFFGQDRTNGAFTRLRVQTLPVTAVIVKPFGVLCCAELVVADKATSKAPLPVQEWMMRQAGDAGLSPAFRAFHGWRAISD